MNNTFSLEQISKTGNLDANLILRQYKLDIMARFMEMKSNNPKLTQKQICKELGFSDSTVKRYRNDIKMPSPYRIDGLKRTQMSSNDPKRPQLTSIELEKPQLNSNHVTNTQRKRKSKNITGGSLVEETNKNNIDEKYLDNLIAK